MDPLVQDDRRAAFLAMSLLTDQGSVLTEEIRTALQGLPGPDGKEKISDLFQAVGVRVPPSGVPEKDPDLSTPYSMVGARRMMTILFLAVSGSEVYANGDIRRMLWEMLKGGEDQFLEQVFRAWGYQISEDRRISRA
jgi:hypothetical protein